MIRTGTKSLLAIAGITTVAWCGQASIAMAATAAPKNAPTANVWAGENFDGTSYQLTFDKAVKGQCINTDFAVGSAANITKNKSKTKQWMLTAFPNKDCSGKGIAIGGPGKKLGDLTSQSLCMQQAPKATQKSAVTSPDESGGSDDWLDPDWAGDMNSDPDTGTDANDIDSADSTTVQCGQVSGNSAG